MDHSADRLAEKREQLLDALRNIGSCVVAYSGGVDSVVAAQAAFLALGDKAVAVTAVSPSLATGELDLARSVAQQIGIRHETVATSEFERPEYRRNAPDRCYHCKTELYTHLEPMRKRLGLAAIINGANLDDAGDYRPGMAAAREHGVRSPLLECGLTKADVRALAAYWNLPVWDKPAMPCLSSRIAYGEEATPERVAMIDRAERFLAECGFPELRVRYHTGDMARIEVPLQSISRLAESPLRDRVVETFREIGFRFITVDLEGFRSGNLNQLIALQIPSPAPSAPQSDARAT